MHLFQSKDKIPRHLPRKVSLVDDYDDGFGYDTFTVSGGGAYTGTEYVHRNTLL